MFNNKLLCIQKQKLNKKVHKNRWLKKNSLFKKINNSKTIKFST